MNTIQSKWDEARKVLLPKDAGPDQAKDMKHAFYAGAMSVLYLVGAISDEPSEETSVAMLDALHQEVRDYAASLQGKK